MTLKFKIGNNNPEALMVDDVRVDTHFAGIFNPSNVLLWNTYNDAAGGSDDLGVLGLWFAPYYSGSGLYTQTPYPVDWGTLHPGHDWADSDNNKWGYIYDSLLLPKNITYEINSNFPNAAAPPSGWNWSSDSGWGVCIMLASRALSNYIKTINGELKEYYDFGNFPIIITFTDNRFDSTNWQYDINDVTISNDKKTITITIQRVPYDTCIALIGYDSDSSITHCQQMMSNVNIYLENMLQHLYNTFYSSDPSSVESYKTYLGNNLVYEKDKTFDNCWKKYKMVFPYNYRYLASNIQSNSNILFLNPVTIKVNDNISNWSLFGQQSTTVDYSFVNFLNCQILIKKGTATISWERKFTNVDRYEDSQGNDISNSLISSGTGRSIPAFSAYIHKDLSENSISYDELILTIVKTSDDELILEFIPGNYSSSDITCIRQNGFSYKLNVPTISDFCGKTKVLCEVFNDEFWNLIKNWYLRNTYDRDCFESGETFKNSNLFGEFTLNLPNYSFLYGSRNFTETYLKKINLIQSTLDSHFSSPKLLFDGMRYLENMSIQFSGNQNFICGATNIEGMFDGCAKLRTYPSKLIKWNENRANSLKLTISCTLCDYAFQNSGFVEIPSYSNVEDENTIVCANNTKYMFNGCSKLVTINPIIDMVIVLPENAKNMFTGCDNLTSVRIKNLNHGDWDFSGTAGSLGNFYNLNSDSLVYLVNNLIDLQAEHINNYNYESNVNNSFVNWDSSYKYEASITPNWNYAMDAAVRYLCKKRFSVNDTTNYITQSTELSNSDHEFKVDLLLSGDILKITTNNGQVYIYNDEQEDYTLPSNGDITTDCRFKITGTNTIKFLLLNNDTTKTNIVYLEMLNGVDWTIPRTDNAILYLPTSCIQTLLLNILLLTNWTTKGWTIRDKSNTILNFNS